VRSAQPSHPLLAWRAMYLPGFLGFAFTTPQGGI
jgi:hypothetical protein